MNAPEEIRKEQQILKETVEIAIATFEEKTGISIDSLSTVITRKNHACGILQSRKIEITYQELKRTPPPPTIRTGEPEIKVG